MHTVVMFLGKPHQGMVKKQVGHKSTGRSSQHHGFHCVISLGHPVEWIRPEGCELGRMRWCPWLQTRKYYIRDIRNEESGQLGRKVDARDLLTH